MSKLDQLWAECREAVRTMPTRSHHDIGEALKDAAAGEVAELHRAWGYSDHAYLLAEMVMARCRRHLQLLAGMLAADQLPGPAQTAAPQTDETGKPVV